MNIRVFLTNDSLTTRCRLLKTWSSFAQKRFLFCRFIESLIQTGKSWILLKTPIWIRYIFILFWNSFAAFSSRLATFSWENRNGHFFLQKVFFKSSGWTPGNITIIGDSSSFSSQGMVTSFKEFSRLWIIGVDYNAIFYFINPIICYRGSCKFYLVLKMIYFSRKQA